MSAIPDIALIVTNLKEKETGYLHGRIDVDGVALHVEMIQVVDVETSNGTEQRTVGDPINDERYEDIMRSHESDRGYETYEWDNRQWVIHIFPYGR